ncbi:DUF2782 domain-containing protein [Frateuria soli]|uniref:DUF2782 domain-containing protein n=1 Tax=Frateuria soli TaxID=1542730 RepID=UPI001E3707EE|nr:DUF2782 domain-containing protein [Frateuria soli]UGB37775.1 DUF2782 domain-containing protein [Frateuria soli]
MKLSAALVLLPAFLAAPAFAQSTPPPVNVPPPPGMNDPGVKATPPAAPAQSVPATPAQSGTSLQPRKPAPIRSGEPMPEVSVHRQGENTVQEYRRNGQLYMVVVTPPNGITQTYMVDPSGRLVDEHGQKPTRPVMYKILEWGKSRPATPASASTAGD